LSSGRGAGKLKSWFRFPPGMASFSILNPQSRAVRRFIERLSRSRFFTISVALHFIFVLAFGSIVLVKQVAPKTDFDDSTGGLVAPAPPSAAEPIQPMNAPAVPATAVSNVAPQNALSVIMTPTNNSAAFSLPAAPMTAPTTGNTLAMTSAPSTPRAPSFGGIPAATAKAMAGFTNWRASGDSGSGVGHDRAFKFTAYLAKYEGGDWASTVRLDNGKISTGSLPNLLFLIRKWSRNKIDANPEAVPLDLASDKLFTEKPPFIFFTGHRDFVLTDKEVENLQKYLQLGGAIWGDSSLPGSRSRFDLAFRREMKRVLPDQNVVWETLPPDHPIFTQTYYPEIHQVPEGLNYYQEPVYALKLYGEISVLYTANDYGDMWQIGLTENGEIDNSRDENDRYVAQNHDMLIWGDSYFRNLNVKSLNSSYKFGINIVLHLLTRWEEKLRNVPTGL
jgi:hypothetical protein